MTSKMSSNVLTIVQEATRMQEVTDSILEGMRTRIRSLEIQNSDLNQRTIALEMATKEMETKLATAKALREVEAMAQMALNQLDEMNVPELAVRVNHLERAAPVVESLDVVTALNQIADNLMIQVDKGGQMMSSVIAMRAAAKGIQEVVKLVQVMQAS